MNGTTRKTTNGPTTPIPIKLMPLELASPRTSAEWLDEPDLLFAKNKRHIDPKTGIMLYGPRSLGTTRHKQEVHVGFIGTTESAEAARTFYKECTAGVSGDEDHEPFPGCMPDRGFRCQLHTYLIESIKRNEYLDIVGIKNKRQQFEACLNLLQQKIDLLTNHRDHPLDYIVLALPQELYRKCRSVEYVEKGIGKVYRNLRRSSFKAMGDVVRQANPNPAGNHDWPYHKLPEARPRLRYRLEPVHWPLFQGRGFALGTDRLDAGHLLCGHQLLQAAW